tara:strand:+ start:159 stop:356 length:198 start_codon:yes stop_codon:yes gene_type:complete
MANDKQNNKRDTMTNKKYFIHYEDKQTNLKGKQIIKVPNLISLVSSYNNFKEENTDLIVWHITEE